MKKYRNIKKGQKSKNGLNKKVTLKSMKEIGLVNGKVVYTVQLNVRHMDLFSLGYSSIEIRENMMKKTIRSEASKKMTPAKMKKLLAAARVEKAIDKARDLSPQALNSAPPLFIFDLKTFIDKGQTRARGNSKPKPEKRQRVLPKHGSSGATTSLLARQNPRGSFREVAKKIRKEYKEPTSLINERFPFNSPNDQAMGTERIDNTEYKMASSMEKEFISHLNTSPRVGNQPFQAKINSTKETITKSYTNEVVQTSFNIQIQERLKKNIQGVKIRLIKDDGSYDELTLEPKEKTKTKFYPFVPPYIGVTRLKATAARIVINTKDSAANGFQLWKKVDFPGNTRWSKISDGEIWDEIILTTEVDENYPTIFRILPKVNGQLFHNFRSYVLPPRFTAPKYRISMVGWNLPKGNKITISNIPFEVMFISLYRYSSHTNKTKYLGLKDVSSKEIEFLDKNDLRDGFNYKYFVKLHADDGIYDNAENITINYQEMDPDEKGSILITNKEQGVNKRSGAGASFTMLLMDSATEASTVKTSLEKLGLANDFSEEIAGLKTDLNDIIKFGITRHDLKSGDSVFYGLFDQGDFGDTFDFRPRGAGALQQGRKYVYEVRLYRTDVRSLINTKIVAEDTKRKIPYKYTPAKYFKKKQGIKELGTKKDDTFIFEEGKTHVVAFHKVTMPPSGKSTLNLNGKIFGGQIILNWSFAGKSQVDQFILYARYQGTTSAVGCCMNLADSSNFVVHNKEMMNYPGKVRFYVEGIDNEYNKICKSNTIILNVR